MPPDDMPSHIKNPVSRERLDQFSRFLTHTTPRGQDVYWDQRRQLLGKELSVANILRGDMPANLIMVRAIEEMLHHGQIGLARTLIMNMVGEFKMTMSFDGMFIEQLLSNKIEYAQTQNVHEYVHPAERRGLFGRRR